jgi:hypothetical protein
VAGRSPGRPYGRSVTLPRVLRPRALLVLAALLAATVALGCGSEHSAAARAAVPRHPPVVFISFDEFSTTSLVGAGGKIDAVRYPNFAQLARDGDWFPYATAPADETPRAMGALLTGRLPARGQKPVYAQMPHNVFTLLGANHYRVDSSEEVTSLCPRRLCPHVRAQNQASVLHELAQGRPQRFQKWVSTIHAGARPTLYFKHVLMPHAPWRYLPSGQSYVAGGDPVPGWGHAFSSRWVSTQKYQRHLLQLGYVDRLVGSVISRLKTQGMYDKALIVVTADNGESFGRVDNGHEIDRRNFGDIALTPLFVKRPGQSAGGIQARHVRTEDVVPTLAQLTHTKIHYRVSGRSFYGRSAAKIPAGAVVYQRSGRSFRLTSAGLHRWAKGAQALKLRLFGAGNGAPGLYGNGPYRGLVGRPVGELHPSPRGTLRAGLDNPRSYADVHPGAAFVPSYVTGTVTGGTPPAAVAVAIDGRIAGTSPTFRTVAGGPFYYATLVPPSSFRTGRNTVQLFAVSGSAAAPGLRGL